MALLRLLAVLPAVFLVACQADERPRPVATATAAGQPTAVTPVMAPQGFRCPPAGLRVVLPEGTLTHHGPDSADSAVCRATTAAGVNQRLLLNFVPLPIHDEASVRAGLARLWPLEVGKTTDFSFIGRTRDQSTFRFAERWRVDRAERITLAGALRDVLVISRTQEGMLGNLFLGTQTYWYDPAIGVFLKRDVAVTRGTSSTNSFEVTAIELPAGS